MMIKKPELGSAVRPAANSDIQELVDIDREAEVDPWDDSEWRACLKDSKRIIYVAVVRDVIGVLVVENNEDVGEQLIVKLIVDPTSRRHGAGSALVNHVRSKFDKLSTKRKLVCRVPDDNLDGQKFLKAMGFKADRKPVKHSWGDEYEFSVLVGSPKYKGKNRISDHWGLENCDGK